VPREREECHTEQRSGGKQGLSSAYSMLGRRHAGAAALLALVVLSSLGETAFGDSVTEQGRV
jgi:hypothetical protein